jgi:hypothetical protein
MAITDGHNVYAWGFMRYPIATTGYSITSWIAGGADSFTAYPSGDQDWVILTRVFSATASKTSVNSTTLTSLGATGGANWRALYLGNDPAAGRPGDVDIAEVIIYDAAKSDDECAAVINYLSAKYAIALTGSPWGVVGEDNFESYSADDAVDGLAGGTGFNGVWEGH